MGLGNYINPAISSSHVERFGFTNMCDSGREYVRGRTISGMVLHIDLSMLLADDDHAG